MRVDYQSFQRKANKLSTGNCCSGCRIGKHLSSSFRKCLQTDFLIFNFLVMSSNVVQGFEVRSSCLSLRGFHVSLVLQVCCIMFLSSSVFCTFSSCFVLVLVSFLCLFLSPCYIHLCSLSFVWILSLIHCNRFTRTAHNNTKT